MWVLIHVLTSKQVNYIAVEVKAWLINYIPLLNMDVHVITYPCPMLYAGLANPSK